jgi:S1-C subfamily serine protease
LSAYGTPGEAGVLILEISAGSPLVGAGVHTNDVALAVNDQAALTIEDLAAHTPRSGAFRLTVLRNQRRMTVTVARP